jgi:hypothetical protein
MLVIHSLIATSMGSGSLEAGSPISPTFTIRQAASYLPTLFMQQDDEIDDIGQLSSHAYYWGLCN